MGVASTGVPFFRQKHGAGFTDGQIPCMRPRLPFVLVLAALAACAPHRPATPPPGREALLVIPGFGYGDRAGRIIRGTRDTLAGQGMDLFIADYLRRGGVASSRNALLEFYRKNGLHRYERVHVFAYIVGSWTLNPGIGDSILSNVRTVIYDRSPYQERAPRVAVERLRFPAWFLYGSVLFDVANSAYPPVDTSGRRVGILVETMPTGFIRRYAGTAEAYGPFDFRCPSLGQAYHDCAYVDLNHDEMYTQFPRILPDLLRFIRSGRFGDTLRRVPPVRDSLKVPKQG
jgi:hypothetical protein